MAKKRRSAKEMTRVYGEPARRAWLKAQPCVACVLLLPILASCDGPWHSDLAHVETGGTGRKADASKTAPMCRKHHRMYDEHRDWLAEPKYRALIVAAASTYDEAWRARSAAPQRGAP